MPFCIAVFLNDESQALKSDSILSESLLIEALIYDFGIKLFSIVFEMRQVGTIIIIKHNTGKLKNLVFTVRRLVN